ncbi:MAG: DUF4920 domain-containing protein [Planctomycetota bacterium]
MQSTRFLPVLTALVLAAAATAQDKKLDANKYDHFGDGITVGSEPLTLRAALKNAKELDGKTVRVRAPITGVCQVKGCWMNLGKPDQKGNPPMFVKFKDYGFFMPKDASGRVAIVEGTMSFKQETVAETRHYLEDAGKHEEAKKVTEGRKVLRFMASGVAIEKPIDLTTYQHFGAGIEKGTAPVTLAEVMESPKDFVGKKVRVRGPITGVCQVKGCWMNLGKPDAKGNPPIFVKFKDYAFFVPKDASGRDAILEGQLSFKQETVAETRHYLEDAGKHEQAKKVTEGRKVLRFMADGVAIEKPAKKK